MAFTFVSVRSTVPFQIQILQKKLESKTKAFAILINELESLKHERDQFKSLADSLQEKCVQLKKQVNTKIEPLAPFHSSQPANDVSRSKDQQRCSMLSRFRRFSFDFTQ